MELTATLLRQLLEYDPMTGVFTWRQRTSPRAGPGEVAGCVVSPGRVLIRIGGRAYLAHRLAWLYMHGTWPEHFIDHMDGNPLNNRLANLRDATRTMNNENRRRPDARNKTGFLGVYEENGRYRAHIGHAGKRLKLGSFSTAEEAHAAYLAAKRKLHVGNTL